MDLSGYDYLHLILGGAILLSIASNVFHLYECPCFSINSTSSNDNSVQDTECIPKPLMESEFIDLPPDTTVGYVGTHVAPSNIPLKVDVVPPSNIPVKVEIEIERHLSKSSLNDLDSEFDL